MPGPDLPDVGGEEAECVPPVLRVGKNPVFFFKTRFFFKPGLKKNQPSGFFSYFCFCLVFLGIFGFLNIFAQKREFLWFFQFQEHF